MNEIIQFSLSGFLDQLQLELDTRFDAHNFLSVISKLDKLLLLVQLECKDFFVAGGCLRDACIAKDYNDIDIWTVSQTDFEIVRDYLIIMGYRKCYDSVYAETYKKRENRECENEYIVEVNANSRKNAIQIIKSFALQQEHINDFIIRTLKNFDFTINQIAYQPAERMIYVSRQFMRDVPDKKLYSYNLLQHSQLLLQRIKKFAVDGWLPSIELLAAVQKLPRDICSCGENHIKNNQYVWTFGETVSA